MKIIQNSIRNIFRILILLVIVFQISIDAYSQNEGQWKLKGDNTPRVVNSGFLEDSAGNIIIKSYYNHTHDIETSIYTSTGDWIDYKTVRKNKSGIYGEKGFVPFAQYKISNSEEIYGSKYDLEGQLWILTGKGLLLCKNNGHTRFLEDVDFQDTPEFINNYVVTENKIYFFLNNKFKLLKQMDKKEKIYSARLGKDKRVWILTKNGILKCENGNISQFLEDISFKSDDLLHPMFTEDFVLSKNGIYHFENDKFEKIREVSMQETYKLIKTDNEGRTWFIKRFVNGPEEYFILSYYKNGNWKEFSNQIFGEDFHYKAQYTSFPKNLLYFRPDGKIWINGGDFIAYIEEDNIHKLPIDKTKIPKYFLFDDLAFDRENNVYISCNVSVKFLEPDKPPFYNYADNVGGCLLKYTGEEFVYYSNEDTFKNQTINMFIREMLIDKKNNLWIITGVPSPFDPKSQGGAPALRRKSSIIVKMSKDKTEVFDKSDGIDQSYYKSSIFEDTKGRIWIGSFLTGVYMYEYEN